ncbi:LysR substrate-binding domain-containing protein [Cronobacter dublinensis]|uniref:LysR substrate-binding domain-containing protein n=1 Tax=Cronobacter dublinensis TaxID=413497 RepID=UPI001F31A236|nr:LysR substrate-binding domain-containing protein [Cronobacter dublinensis]
MIHAEIGISYLPAFGGELHNLRQRLPSGKRYHWEYERQGQRLALDVPGSLTLDSRALMAEAAAGLGVAYAPERYVQQALAAQRQVRLLEAWTIASQGLALYFSHHRHMPVALRLFVDAIKAAPPA